jgi:phytoene synthase
MAAKRGRGGEGVTTAEAYAFCRDVARREAKNFYWAFQVLPRAKSDAMCAVYAFMRRADDLSDDETRSLEQRRALMTDWVARWRGFLEGKTGGKDEAVFLALGDAQQRFEVPQGLLEELVEGVTMDLQPRVAGADGLQTFVTFEDLYRYCYLVASVVGLVCIRIFGYTDARAEEFAEETGIAFQLTNILRDVKEDADRGRVYVPEEMMAEFGVPMARVLALSGGAEMSPEERAMLATLAVRAERYYGSARKLIPLLDRDSRAAMWVLTKIYHRLLDRIAAGKMEVFSKRVSVPTWEKAAILLRGAMMATWNRVLG